MLPAGKKNVKEFKDFIFAPVTSAEV